MKNLFLLLNVNLKTSIRMNNVATTPIKKIGYGFLVILLVLTIGGSYAFGMYYLAESLPLEYQVFTLLLGIFSSYVAVIFMGSFAMFGNIFAAKDTKYLLTLPISYKTLYISKFLTTYATNSLIAVAIMMINGVIYSLFVQTNALFFLFLIIIALTIAFIPLTLASLIAFAIVKISRVLPYKNFFAVLFSLIGVAALLALQLFVQQELMSGITVTADIASSIIDSAMKYFPPFAFALNALTEGSIVGMLLHLAVTAIFFGLTTLFCSWGYAKSVSFSQSSSKKKKGRATVYKSTNSKSVISHFIINEIRGLIRLPVYAINSLSGLFVGPLIIIMPTVTAGEAVDFSVIIGSIPLTHIHYLVLAVAAMMVFVASINPAIATIISREGKAFKQLKILPIRPNTIVLGKFIACYSISFITIILMAVTAHIMFEIEITYLLLASLLANFVSIFLSAIDAIVDILRPKLDWVNEARAIKQNANVFISMLINWVVLVGIGFAVVFFSINLYVVLITSALLATASLIALNNIAISRFEKIKI